MKAKLVPLSSTDNQQRFYLAVLEYLNEGGFHYLVGGGHGLGSSKWSALVWSGNGDASG